jgi:hypothetical protein
MLGQDEGTMSRDSVIEQACSLIRDAPIEPDPFPHIVIDGIFPDQYYEELLRNLPAVSALSIPVKFGMMKIDDDDATFRALPEAGQRFWAEFDNEVKPPICYALLKRYRPYAKEKLSLIFGDCSHKLDLDDLEDRDFRPLRGIVQCRVTGARQAVHVDKATALFAYLFYFAADDTLRPFGTIFYEAKNRAKLLELYRANRGIRAWFPTESEAVTLELEPRTPLEFCRNRLVSYVNLPYSLHGVATDASAPRYSMQSFCDLPLRITLPLYEGWTDSISPTGSYRGDG